MFERKITGRDCPWLTSEIRSKINQRDYLLQKAKGSKAQKAKDKYKRAFNYICHMTVESQLLQESF